MKTVFIGDSVTDCDRETIPPFGNGWVSMIVKSQRWPGEVINVGTSGNRLVDLVKRWDTDVLSHKPEIVSIAIGINDTWRRYDDNDPTSAEEFELNYRNLISYTKTRCNPLLVLCEPFLLPVKPEMKSWREDLDPKIAVISRLAAEFKAVFVPFDKHLNGLLDKHAITEIAEDGIHPTQFGHTQLANYWISRVSPLILQ